MIGRRWWATGLVLAVACFHRAPVGPVPNPNVITEDEIRSAEEGTIYDVIAKLRPQYLRDRGPIALEGGVHDVATVFLNSQEYGPINIMRNVPAGNISEVRYYSGIDAVTKFGRYYGTGVIQLISRDH
ncbi:MAG: hypothetical protein ACRENQ_00600 [Gemmatimonadaceae bacterium]